MVSNINVDDDCDFECHAHDDPTEIDIRTNPHTLPLLLPSTSLRIRTPAHLQSLRTRLLISHEHLHKGGVWAPDIPLSNQAGIPLHLSPSIPSPSTCPQQKTHPLTYSFASYSSPSHSPQANDPPSPLPPPSHLHLISLVASISSISSTSSPFITHIHITPPNDRDRPPTPNPSFSARSSQRGKILLGR